MNEKSVDVLFVHTVYNKTKRYVHELKTKKWTKQSISGYGLYNETKNFISL